MKFEDDFEFLGEGSGLIGRDKEKDEVVYRIASGNMLLIEGERGVGKTAMLKYAIDNFRGLGKVVYLDVGTFGRRMDVAQLLVGRPKGMILLIDNIEYLSKSNNKKIKYFYDQDDIRAVVFATGNSKAINFTDAIRSRIGRNVMELKPLKAGEALEIARDRMGEDYVVSDELLKELYKRSGNLRVFLKNCDLLCAHLDEGEVDEDEIFDVLDLAEEEDVLVAKGCLECGGELLKIGEHWRCENCDSYCEKCGALSDEEDCPVCGKGDILEDEDE